MVTVLNNMLVGMLLTITGFRIRQRTSSECLQNPK